jgi:hypothetical protein
MFTKLLDRICEIGAYFHNRRAYKILKGLGFS